MLKAFKSRINGELLDPASSEFGEVRMLWSVRADQRPDLIVRCADAADVQTSVDFARDEGMALSVKNGGHSYAMNTVRDTGLLIDMSALKNIAIDPETHTVIIGGGVTCGELDSATRNHGLATPMPTTSTVGVAGAALGGGIGFLSRKYGLTLDNLISATVVTADGRLVPASEDENPDLFWALRGGGGNFGVVTSLKLRLHQVKPEVLTGNVIYPVDDAAGDKLAFYSEFMSEAPDEFYCAPVLVRVPPREPFPEEFHGKPALYFQMIHLDPDASGFVEPLRQLGEPILDLVAPSRYTDLQAGTSVGLPTGQRYYSKAHDLDQLSEGAINTVLDHVSDMQGEFTIVYFNPNGGAIAAVDHGATAFGSRAAAYGFHCIAGWTDPTDDEQVMSWASQLHEEMATHASGGVYLLLIADDEPERIPSAYGDNYSRLVQLKKLWDPENLFQSNYNIPPKA